MRSNYKKLGPYIEQVNIRNNDLAVDLLLGVSIQKILMPSIANTVGTNMKTYKVIKNNQFAYGPVTSRNGDKISIALLENFDEAIVSQAYTVFRIINPAELLPEYLMMWFRRPEFDRYARFKSHGSARETFDWDELCEVELPIPSPEKQQEIVDEYNTGVNRIKLNEELNTKLEETAQTLYRHWFVDFEFPITKKNVKAIDKPELEGKPYLSSGGEMVYIGELGQEIPSVWENGSLSDLCSYTSNREEVRNLTTKTYLSTESMLVNRGGITESNNLPNAVTTSKFNKNEILISNIRPYFKKIWLTTFSGGCSNDILCFVPHNDVNPLFIYYCLERDSFFEYIMQGAKGTKMPRGDKDWIMNYSMALPDEDIMEEFGLLVSSLTQYRNFGRVENELLRTMSQLILSKMANPVAFQTEGVI